MAQAIFDEMGGPGGDVRQAYRKLQAWLEETPLDILTLRREEAETFFRRIGITFAVYGEGGDPERIIPFDIIPRIIEAAEWRFVSEGLIQRVRALNAFIADVYGEQEILKAGVVPRDQVLLNDTYRYQMQGVAVPQNVYTHIAGIDMVRVGADEFYVL
ncbi:MAG TPA: hypothetical protein DCF73_10870, partial [Rhodobiaceae bacterium]|nr:hypothetical protein [Rhodobiaceae bacterium]